MTAAPIFASVLNQPAVLMAFGAAPFIYLAALAIGRWLKRVHHIPLGLMFQLLCISLAAFAPLRAMRSALLPGDSRPAWHFELIRAFDTALVLLGVIFGIQVFRRFYWQNWFSRRHGNEAPKLLQQVFGFTVFTAALALVLKAAYGLQIDTFLAGSGIAAVVIGLAMQETLANIVSGIALQFGKPFRIGDWLIVDSQRAEVVEMNWRSTRLRTNDDVYLDIPNKAIVSHTITNLSFPTKVHSNRLRIGFEYSAPPNVVREVLQQAAANAAGVLTAPPPKVFLREFGDSAIIYEVKYSLDDERRFNDIEDAIRTNIWYEARRAGLEIPFPMRIVEIRRRTAHSATLTPEMRGTLARQEFLSPLDDSQKSRLLDHARIVRFGRGEKIIRQGSDGSSMFVIIHGEVDVVLHANGTDTTVATLRAGDAFGEMCLLTGEKRTATIIARADCELWEIERADIQPLLQESQSLADHLGELLARRRMATENILAAQTPPQVVEQKRREYTQNITRKIRALFEI